jgi:hypothetical protein
VELPECLLRRLNICDGQAVIADPLRPHRSDRCYCLDLGDPGLSEEYARELRWLRARAVARSPRLQGALDRRQSRTGRLGGLEL